MSSAPTRDADPPSLGDEATSFGGTSPPKLDVSDALLRDTLHRVWGFSDFRPLQREAMHAILESRDSVVDSIPDSTMHSLMMSSDDRPRLRSVFSCIFATTSS